MNKDNGKMDINNINKDLFVFIDNGKTPSDSNAQNAGEPYKKRRLNSVAGRFFKNPSGVIGTAIIALMLVLALAAPLFNSQNGKHPDGVYSNKRPKSRLLSGLGLDGTAVRTVNKNSLIKLMGIGLAAKHTSLSQIGAAQNDDSLSPVKKILSQGDKTRVRVDVYLQEGFRFFTVTDGELADIIAWQNKSGKQVIYPMIDLKSRYLPQKTGDANVWYKTRPGTLEPIVVSGRQLCYDQVTGAYLEPNYLTDSSGQAVFYTPSDSNMWKIRVLYYNYYQYKNGRLPYYEMGTDHAGYDIFSRLARSLCFSLALALSVSLINIVIGTLYGAVEGYYGGKTDMILERIAEVLGGIPIAVTVTLVGFKLGGAVPQLLIAFLLTGWLGTAGRVRAQFYRFKKRQYVCAAKTLGASDRRIMFYHILPNALGSIITSSVLIIPGVIFSESMLSYLGIISMQGDTPGLGAMLANAKEVFTKYPYQMFFPAAVISLLMIAFNLIGNALREAFDPQICR